MNAKNNPEAIQPCAESWADLLNYRGNLSAGYPLQCISVSGKRKGSLAIHTIFALQREIMTSPIYFLQTYKLFYLQSHVTKKK